ncbi:unnamed protein product [Bursaphelenchus xylophilus]|uniref:(pine wood nematode) hypothetical protein n=1 Tax=Bursaphelenchus xylophilus TaxID=6326 RepID=A0A1I7S730_BURXY|nr:unnamed protein product [Bursaphelenchus xylophilus]CAG9084539.1 unnamed protein product [Bursaphelenchus xylophilus]
MILWLVVVLGFVHAIPIPNGQLGRAEIECGEDNIEIVFLTEDVFQGRVFVVGHSNETECSSRDIGRKTTSIVIPKNKCGVTITRSANPPGLLISTKVMISFHDEFITKVDRGYEISCFYMEAEKTVTYPVSVSMASLQPVTQNAEMPRCRYEVLDPFTKKPVSIVSVGNKLLHRWVCDSGSPDLWCMTVHSCFVEDGSGTEIVILNDKGCAIDRYLLDNLEYGPGLLQAQKEAHAFKFADRIVVNFQCSIKLDIKDGECGVPKCPDLTHQKPRLINKRSHSESSHDHSDVEVRAPSIEVLEHDLSEISSAIAMNEDCVPYNRFFFIISITSLFSSAVTATIFRLARNRWL